MANLNGPSRPPAPERVSILKRRHNGKVMKPIVWWAVGALGVLFVLGAMFYDVETPKRAGIAPPAGTTGSAVTPESNNIPAGSGTQRP